MKHFLLKITVLTAFLCLFCALAQAETLGGTTIQISSASDLEAKLEQINAEGEAAFQADMASRMQRVNIEITADIQLTKRVEFKRGTNVHIYSTPGQQYTIKSLVPVGLLGDTMFYAVGTCYLEFSNLIIDGNQKNCSFFKMSGSEAVLGDNLTVKNFNIVNLLMPRYTLIDCSSTNANLGVENGDYPVNPKLTIKNSQFLNNNSPNGGVLRALNSDVTITNSRFEGNTAKQYMLGGKLEGEGGGALHLNVSQAVITNSQFVNNKSELSGGAVQVFNDSEAVFNNCTFTGNEAVTHGGAICVSDCFDDNSDLASVIEVNGCTFTGNKANGNDDVDQYASSPEAAGGGAIFLHEYCKAYLNEGTVLSGNESADEGGAVYVCFGGQLFVDGARIEENKAATHGGGVYVDGTNAYSGYLHTRDGYVPDLNDNNQKDDAYAAGGKFYLTDGLIWRNTAGKNGGGVYIGGENEVEVNGEVKRFVGGEMLMSGGVITENQAMDMGGGVFVGASGNEDVGGILDMTGGTIHENIAGQDGNTSTGLDDAGAEVFSVGKTSYISVVEASDIVSYLRNTSHTFVPVSHRSLYYEDWYDDYSDQDPDYGKPEYKTSAEQNTGRFTSSLDPDRMVYTPEPEDNLYNALILGRKTPAGEDENNPPADVIPDAMPPQTGDASAPLLYLMLVLASAAISMALRRRTAK